MKEWIHNTGQNSRIGLTINYDQPNPTSDLVLDIFITIGTYLQYNEYYSQTLSDQSPESSSRNKWFIKRFWCVNLVKNY